jgi:outer membrane protein assembly factor BamA
MYKRTPLLVLFSVLILIFSTSQGLGREKKDLEKKKDKKIGTVVLPIIFYMPETRWGFGGGGLLTYRAKNSPEEARPSSLYFQAYYTQNKQWGIELKPEIYLKNEDYIINAYFKMSKFPNKFWGIGNDTPDLEEGFEDEDYLNYTPKMFNFDLSVQRRIISQERLYAGVRFKYEKLDILEVAPLGLLVSGEVPGSSGGKLASLGFILNWDRRDNIFFPRSGNYFQLTADFNSPSFGSDFKFTTFKFDLRKYFPIFKLHVFAVQAILQSVTGEPTFRHMSEIGGELVMRGYYTGRYRDLSMMVLQTELRMKIWKLLGAVVFASVADVAEKIGELSLGNLKYTVGVGLRILVVPKEGTNIRLDYGFGKNTSGFYIMANEVY